MVAVGCERDAQTLNLYGEAENSFPSRDNSQMYSPTFKGVKLTLYFPFIESPIFNRRMLPGPRNEACMLSPPLTLALPSWSTAWMVNDAGLPEVKSVGPEKYVRLTSVTALRTKKWNGLPSMCVPRQLIASSYLPLTEQAQSMANRPFPNRLM